MPLASRGIPTITPPRVAPLVKVGMDVHWTMDNVTNGVAWIGEEGEEEEEEEEMEDQV